MTFTISTNSSSLVTLTGTADDPATILSSATLSAGIYESYLATPWTVTNAGHVLGAITLKSAGLLTNTGTISAGNAIYGHSAAITIANSGTILGSTGNAVRLYAGGSVTNQNGGTISANAGGGGVVINGATGTVVNAGTIAGPGSGSLRSDTGVWLLNGGSVTNQSTGTIKGFYGVYGGGFYNGAGAATTVVNAGNIDALSASGFAVKFAAGYADRVVLDPGAAFIGTVSGGNTIGAAAVSTLELASGASAGTLSGLGSEFVDFGHVSVDTLASWVLTGTNTVASGVTLTNAGSLSGAITLAAGGVLTNASTGTISLSGATPVTGLAGGISTIVNAGLLQGNIGISLSAGGSVSNQTGGIVSGATLGVYLQSGTLTNAGTISTTTGDALQWGSGAVAITNSGSILTGVGNALRLNAGGTVTNLSGGLISVTATNGGGGVVASGGVETVVNAGTILGAPSGTVRAASGVWLLNGGVVTNQSGGTIKGAYGVYGGVHTTVVNAGSIAALSASGFAVQFTAGYADRVVLDPGAAFTGTVSGRNTIGAAAVSTLELASGASAGTLSGLGTQFIDFGQVSLDTLASWVFTGTNTVASGVTFTDSGTLTNTGSLSGKLSLAAGGVLTNASTGTISLSSGSLITGLAGGVSTVVNAGTIAVSQTSAGFGIDLTAGGSVTNQSTGLIAGYVALYATGAAATVVNAGILSGGTTGNAGGIVLNDGGTITNQSTGTITGVNAIYSHNVAISLTNSGTILGGALNFSNGVRLGAGGSVTNQSGGIISVASNSGSGGVVVSGGTGIVVNAGSISGASLGTTRANTAVWLLNGGAVTNQSGGTIKGFYGVYGGSGATTLVNAGSIAALSASGFAVQFAAGYADRVVLDPGAAFTGTVSGRNTIGAAAVSTLELASAASAGTLTGLGTQFVRFVQTTLDAGAAWSLTSSNTVTAGYTLTNAGTLTNVGTLTNAGTLTSAGTLINDGVLVNQSGGRIIGATYGVSVESATGTVINAGVITGTSEYGVLLGTGGVVTNQSGGTISGGIDGIKVATGGAATVTNAGTISGATYAIKFATSQTNRLIVDAGAVFIGTVTGGTAVDATLELASSASVGTLSGFGTQFTNFGTLTVDAAAQWTGVTAASAATILNAGRVTGTNAVYLKYGGLVTNQSGGTISGSKNGIYVQSVAGTVTNLGSIAGTSDVGVWVNDGGSVTNQSGGTISGHYGVYSRLAPGTLINAGRITGTTGGTFSYGAWWKDGGFVTNQSGGTITGVLGGVLVQTAIGTVINVGDIAGTNSFGVLLQDGGFVTNQSGGTISGGGEGIWFQNAGGTVTDAGTVSGGTYAIKFATSQTNRLIVDAGAVFSGTVTGGTAVDATLELASSASAGTISGLGTQFIAFGQIGVDTLASWVLTGANTVVSGVTLTNAGTLSNSGTLTDAGTLINTGSLSGLLRLAAGGVLTNASTGKISLTSATLLTGLTGGASTVVNAGTIAVGLAAGVGIDLTAGGSVSNQSGGLILGYTGIYATGAAATVVNAGTITGGTLHSSHGIGLNAGGAITNQSTGTITGANAIYGAGAAITITNSGTILGGTLASSNAIRLFAGGSITNQSGGVISDGTNAGGTEICINGATGTVVNAGTIVGASAGTSHSNAAVWLLNGGAVTNQSSGTIKGFYGVYSGGSYNGAAAATTVVNAGSISGVNASGFAVKLTTGFANRVVLDPGAAFTGTVSGGNTIGATAVSTLELASGASNGTLSGLGTQYIGFGQTTVDAGATWTLAGANTLSAGGTLSNGGTIFDTGTLINNGYLGGHGTIVVERGGKLTGSGSIAATETIIQLYGVYLAGAGSVTNASGAVLAGVTDGILIGGAGTVSNAGTIAGTTNYGIYLQSGGTVTGASGGKITGGNDGIKVTGAAGTYGTVNNAGTITGTAQTGVDLKRAGTVTNASGGSIGGGTNGVYIDGSGTIGNAGTITGSAGAGAYLQGGGYLTNASSGRIAGSSFGVVVHTNAGTVVNAGSLSGTGTAVGNSGVWLSNGGTVINRSGGRIKGFYGVSGNGAMTVVNAGSISGTNASGFAVKFAAGYTGHLVLDPGAAFTGTVSGGNTVGATAVSTLELASGAATGTLTGLGTKFIDFGQIGVDTLSSWLFTGTNTVASSDTLTNAGSLTVSGKLTTAALVNNGIVLDSNSITVASLTGTGTITIAAGGALEVQGTVSSGETIVFGGPGGYLHIDAPSSFAGTIKGFSGTDILDIKGIAASTVHYAAGSLHFGTAGASAVFAVASGSSVGATASTDGADITALCFCTNTMIQTPSGERAVQTLAVGDIVNTYGGGQRPITWVGVGKVLATRGRRGAATPVIVRKGALADNVPARDLRVTKGHGLYIDSVLIPVEFLVNHRSIVWDDRAQEVELYHIELDAHDVMIADGAPAESYRDDGNRWLFHNANEGWHLPPKRHYADVLTGGPIVDAAWRRILDRAGSRPGLPMTNESDLHLIVDGCRIDATETTAMTHVFRLPNRPGTVIIASRDAVPAELGIARDPRPLGVALRRLTIGLGTRFDTVLAQDSRLTDGFHDYEDDGALRWTNGSGTLPAELFARFEGETELVLTLAATTGYCDPGASLAAA